MTVMVHNYLKAVSSLRYDNDSGRLVRLGTGKEVSTRASGRHYIKIWVDGVCLQYHNVVWVCCGNSIPEGYSVDHIDGDKLNNRIENLRLASSREQTYNTRSYGKTSKYKGVDYNKASGKWFSRIMVSGKSLWLGAYPSEKAAADAYDLAATKYHKEFKRSNNSGYEV